MAEILLRLGTGSVLLIEVVTADTLLKLKADSVLMLGKGS